MVELCTVSPHPHPQLRAPFAGRLVYGAVVGRGDGDLAQKGKRKRYKRAKEAQK